MCSLIPAPMFWVLEWHTHTHLYLISLNQLNGLALPDLHVAITSSLILLSYLYPIFATLDPMWEGLELLFSGSYMIGLLPLLHLSGLDLLLSQRGSSKSFFLSPLPCTWVLKSHLGLLAQRLATGNFIYLSILHADSCTILSTELT